MRLCFVGSARSVHHPARARPFAQRGHTVRLVAVGPIEAGVESEASSEDVIEHVRIEAPRAPSSLGALRAVPRVLSAIRSFAPDILHAHYAGPLAAVAALSGVRPFVVTVMGGDVLFEQHVAPTARQRRAVRRLLARADLILAKSERLARAVGELGDFASKTHTVVWGVDVSRFAGLPSRSEARKRWQLEDRHRVVLSPRILQPLYNVHLLVEALPGLLARQPAALLLLTEYVADPDYRRRIEERATALGVRAHVRFLGTVPAEAMPSLYAAADVVASVPFSDGLPQSVFESMAADRRRGGARARGRRPLRRPRSRRPRPRGGEGRPAGQRGARGGALPGPAAAAAAAQDGIAFRRARRGRAALRLGGLRPCVASRDRSGSTADRARTARSCARCAACSPIAVRTRKACTPTVPSSSVTGGSPSWI
ncbi:MAG: hypothetical protein DMF78_20380 [Acidobacteria bacterium]|nr:MAG: hypothetical protein DMF78_20380 [Acidobacteriota bacterium]